MYEYPPERRSCNFGFWCYSKAKGPLPARDAYVCHSPFPCAKRHTLFARYQVYTWQHTLLPSLSIHICLTMSLLMSLALVFLAVALQVSGQSTTEPQPYCHMVSGNFSNNSDYWLHATPVLRAHWWFDYAPLVRRQYADYWFGWKNISYLFALYVPPLEAQSMQSNAVIAVTPTRAQASISQGNSPIPATPWATLHTLVPPPAMVPTTWTS